MQLLTHITLKINRKLKQLQTSILFPQPYLPPTPRLPQHSDKEYDIIEKLHNTSTKISLWNLIQNPPTYHGMLQEALQNIVVPPSIKPNDVATLLDGMKITNLDITFPQHELPPLKIQNQYDALMIVVIINNKGIRCNLNDSGSTLIFCRINLLRRIDMDKSLLKLANLFICGFYSVARKLLGTITLPIKIGM